MKKRIFSLMAFAVLSIGMLMAQDSKVTTGVVDFQQQRFVEAIKAFDVALQNPGDLKPKNVPKAYYYRAMSRMQNMRAVMQHTMQDENMSDEAKAEKISGLMEDLFNAYDDFKKAKETDDGHWSDKVDTQFKLLKGQMLMGGVQAINQVASADATADEKKEGYQLVVRFMDVANEIDPKDHTALDIRAQAYLGMRDSVTAMRDFQAAAKVFDTDRPDRPDQLAAYIYYRMALLERYGNNDIDKAISLIAKGKEVLEAEHARIMAKKDDYPEEALEKLQNQYTDANDDLNKFELDLLLNSPDKLEEALAKFEKACADEPDNYTVHVAYASLLEKLERWDDAITYYKKAMDIDPDQVVAPYNLGALYSNLAKVKYDASNDETDYDKADVLRKEGDEIFAKAEPYFVAVLKVQPCDRGAIKALKQIYVTLNRTDDFKAMKDKEAACN